VVAVALLGGCGGSSAPATGGAAGVRAVVDRFAADLISGDAKDACSLMTPAAQAALARSSGSARLSCEGVIAAGHAVLTPGLIARIHAGLSGMRITVNGEQARVVVAGGGTPLRYQQGRWYLAGLLNASG
jgi:hypothetical protein